MTAVPTVEPADATPVAYDIVVSAENNDFMAWQCLVFHHSCITHVGIAPIVVVHGDEPELVEGFRRLELAGGRIQRAPNFRYYGDIMYAPWNQVKTTALVDSDKPWLVFVDADMVFLDRFDFAPQLARLDPHTIALDRVPFLVVDESNAEIVAQVCDEVGVDIETLRARPVSGCTPYLIANETRAELCDMWDRTTRTYLERAFAFHNGYDPGVWISSMWGLALAVHALQWDFVLTGTCIHTLRDPELRPEERPILHYSYPNDDFNKRRFNHLDDYDGLWQVTGKPGHTSGAVCDAIRSAGAYFELAS